jgi:Rad3-related DNA helicase
MSGTLHSERVLKEVFGLDNFKVIDAETFNPGTITKLKTGLEKDFKFDNFEKNKVTREEYLKALDKCVEISEKPAVVQVSAFQDLPAINEIQNFNLKNLISEEELIEQQKNDKEGRLVKDFKDGKTKILFTTRCSRGIDFPFSVCNSVVITKFPYPNVQSLFWKILKKNKPCIFWDFYKDKAYRELLQRVYRSVRAPEDHVFLLSPDIRVLESKII